MVELLKLEGITPESEIALVTFGWHVPRARDVFDVYFKNVTYHLIWQKQNSFRTSQLVPTTFALVENNILIAEWFGRLWYGVQP